MWNQNQSLICFYFWTYRWGKIKIWICFYYYCGHLNLKMPLVLNWKKDEDEADVPMKEASFLCELAGINLKKEMEFEKVERDRQ